jgi:hypothetical protein
LSAEAASVLSFEKSLTLLEGIPDAGDFAQTTPNFFKTTEVR